MSLNISVKFFSERIAKEADVSVRLLQEIRFTLSLTSRLLSSVTFCLAFLQTRA
jgi:hypothetical protein